MVAVVVDRLDGDRGLRRDGVQKVVRTLFDFVLVRLLLETGFALFVLSEFLGVAGNVLELLWRVFVEVSTISVGSSAGGVSGS
jgi:hypothetical protein